MDLRYELGYGGGCIDPYVKMWVQQWPEDEHEEVMGVLFDHKSEGVISVYDKNSLVAYGLFSPLNNTSSMSSTRLIMKKEIDVSCGDEKAKEWMISYLEHIQEVSGVEIALNVHNLFRRVKKTDYYFGGNLVLPDYRGQGIGAELLDRRLRITKERGCTGIFSHCSSPISLHLYERRGFTKILSTTPAYYNGDTSVLVAKEL